MKKLFTILLALMLTVPVVLTAKGFSDTKGNRSNKAIEYLSDKEVVEGYADGTFRPEQTITRAEFLKIILEAGTTYEDGDCTEMKITYSDVSEDDWFFGYICYATNNDIVNGYSDGTFRPEEEINFVEASKIVANVFTLESEEQSGEEWYKEFVETLQKERVVPGTVISLTKKLTRGEMAEIVWGLDTGNEVENDTLGDLPQINSCEELAVQFEKYQARNRNSYYDGDILYDKALDTSVTTNAVPTAAEESASTAAGSTEGASDDYSSTNIQEFGVDEADIIKNDGSHIFLIKNNTVRIVKAYPPENMLETAIIQVNDDNSFQPTEMYLDGDRLTIIGNQYNYVWEDAVDAEPQDSMEASIEPYYGYYDTNVLKVLVYDVADRTNPKKLRSVNFDASYTDSRKIGDIVYIIANKYQYPYGILDAEDIVMPRFEDSASGDETVIAGCSDVRYFPNFDNPNYLIIAGIDTRDTSKKVEREMYLGSSDTVYASTDNLFVTRSSWGDVYYEKDGEEGWTNGEFTEIYKFALDAENIEFKAKAKAEGRILNQFSMSEFDDYFRIATQKGDVWNGDSESMVTIFDENMEEKSSITGIAPGENMHSARFVGEKGYLVTFKKVDPLFVLDLNPEDPKVVGKLKIPGYSDYLHPYDETHMIGFGKDTVEASEEEIDARNLDFAWYQGVKISMFDVSDPENPKEMFTTVIGDRGSETPVIYDHKALLFDKEKGVLALPITVAEVTDENASDDTYGDTVFSGAYIYSVDLENGFKLKGTVSNFSDDDYLKSGYYFYGDTNKTIQRVIYIGDYFYAIAPGIVKALDWDDASVVNSVELKTLDNETNNNYYDGYVY